MQMGPKYFDIVTMTTGQAVKPEIKLCPDYCVCAVAPCFGLACEQALIFVVIIDVV